ncbi:unnamed protein product [Diamesa hyperborea]
MNSRHSYGAPVSVLNFNNEEKVVMNKLELCKIFLHPEVEKRKVVIVSIVGPFRQGKSFFLNFCLRYMYANYKSIANPSNDLRNKDGWMGSSEESLTGFSWKSGSKRDTSGIIIWSDVFLHTNEKDEKVAIVLMDTQGLFDVKTLSNEGSIILALGTMLSSIQILNLFRDIHDIHLKFLQFAITYAKIAADDDSSNLFQNFWFLIRDWYCPADYEFGIEGGRNYLKNVLDMKGKKDMSDIVDIRKYIKSTFERLNCCLMPYPEKTVATEKNYVGSWGKMDKEFKETIEICIPQILSPKNLVLKKICNKFVNCYEMKEFIESFFTLYQSDNMPETRLVYDLTIEKQMNNLIDKCSNFFQAVKNQCRKS